MPTGYTADIEKDIDFKTFALKCARAFGACIDMRDSPSDQEIPEKFENQCIYDSDRIREQAKELDRLKNLSEEQTEIEAIEEWKKLEINRINYLADKLKLKIKYEVMLKQVEMWEPPTSEHNSLKRFMIEQIKDSINSDCYPEIYNRYAEEKRRLSGKEWLETHIKECEILIERRKESQKEEMDRLDRNNKWIADLRKSLS